MNLSLRTPTGIKNVLLLFRLLPKDLASETFVEMDSDHQKTLINSFSDLELKEVINELYDRGHTIIFITARGKLYANPDEITKKYLANHGIKYHKLIANSGEKGIVT